MMIVFKRTPQLSNNWSFQPDGRLLIKFQISVLGAKEGFQRWLEI